MKSYTGQRKRDKDRRRAEAEARVEKWRSLTPRQKVEALDARLGTGKGAKKQRESLDNEISVMVP